MSVCTSANGLRNSKSSSALAAEPLDYDSAAVPRRSFSEDSRTLSHKTHSKASVLTPSSSMQSSVSFFTNSLSSSSSLTSSSNTISATGVEAAVADAASTPEALMNDTATLSIEESLPYSSNDRNTISSSSWRQSTGKCQSRPPSSAGSRPISSGSESVQTNMQNGSSMAPLYFGDYHFPTTPSLQHLRQVFLLDKSSKQKDFHQSLQLHAHLIGLALAARISRGLDLAYDHAHDAFKNRQRPDRRNEFTSSFNYAHDETERIMHHALAHPQPRPSFLDMMSQAPSTAILAFLHRLRTDHTILATAFKNMQSQELDALLLPERLAVSMQPQPQLGRRSARERGYSMQSIGSLNHHNTQPSSSQHPKPTQQQQQSQNTIPNFVNNQDVVHIILGNLFGASSFEREHTLRTGVIKSIFVALLSEKKGERLMTEILQRYIIQSEWHHSSRVKAAFERTLSDLIQRGDSILSGVSDDELNANALPIPPSNSHSHSHFHHQHQHQQQTTGKTPGISIMKETVSECSTPMHGIQGVALKDMTETTKTSDPRFPSSYEMTARQCMVEEFYTEACLDLLRTLKEFCPPVLLELSRLIFAELDEVTKPYASLIIIVKFFFYRFMNKCVAYPETYGMMHDVFVSEKQRQRILFTTHQRLYRYVTSILTPVPGWESRSPVIDPRIRDEIDSFVGLFSEPPKPRETSASQYSLSAITELSSPAPVRMDSSRHAEKGDGSKMPTVVPYLLLCPSDVTTLFYFVCPKLRTPQSATSLLSSAAMTRSSSFNGKGAVVTRQRTSSETPPTYPAALRAAAAAAAAGTSGSSTNSKATHPPSATRAHKRLSPSFSFFSGAAASLPFKAKPPPRLTLEKSMNAPAESSYKGTTFLSLSGIKPGQVASPRTATVEVTSSSGHAAASKSCTPPTDSKSQCSSTHSATLSSSRSSINKSMTHVKHWADETLVPDLKAAVQELKKIQPGPIKEVPWAVNNPALTPLREPWALVYVQYGGNPKGGRTTNHTSESIPEQQERGVSRDGQQTSQDILVEVGLSLAPSCMAMVLENSSAGDASRVVTVTKPILVDQAMDSAGGDDVLRTHVDVDLGVEGSDTDSILSPEDSSLGQRSQTQTTNDKELSILRINSKHMLSSVDQSGTRMIPVSQEQAASSLDDDHTRAFGDNRNTSAQRRLAADRAWKTRIRQTVHSEADMPDDVVTVARSIFKVLREFDLVPLDTFEDMHASSAVLEADHESIRSFLLQGVEQAYQFGNHAAAIGLHHSLRVLETSQVLRQLDSSKLIYLLAMPIKHRLEHREERARSRTVWESFAHSWHMRLVTAIERKRESLSTLRIKMYYQTCVRTSRAFEKSLGVVTALSRHNMDIRRRYPSAEAWERDNGLERGWETSGVTPKTERDLTSSWDDYGRYAEPTGESKETDSRRYSGNSGSPLQAQRPAKVRRSSFSAYVDSMSLRSFGSHSFLESNLTHLKEKERATFSSSYNPSHHGTSWGNSSMSNPTGSTGSMAEATDVFSDFNMDMREVEAVQRWITDSGIHNFLPGEDNFLRFCMEVESAVQGIGLGGTGIHGAGIPQALNGTIATSLSSSGSDFFVMEVAKYNSQFVTGMGPSETVVQAKPGAASGVAEFIVNSFKNGHAASSVPSTAGNHLFSSAASSANSISAPGNSNSSSGSGYSTQPSSTAAPGSNSSSISGRSSVVLRQILQNNHQNTQETTPVLHDEPTSIYASPPGPTYALYNPPYSTATQGPSSSYSSSMASRGASSIVGSHHPSPPRDMTGFLRKLQLKLSGLLLSEWLDIFGDIEADTWFTEFLDEMSSIKRNHGTAQDDQDDYASTVDQKQVDVSDNDQSCCPTESFDSTGESTIDTCSRNSTRSGSSRPPDLRPGGSQAALHSHGFKVEESASIEYGQNELEDEHQQRQLGFRPASLPQPVVDVRESLKNTSSLSSILNTTDHQARSERRRSSQVVPAIEVNGKDASAKPKNSGKSLLCPPEVRTFGLEARNPVGPYDLDEAYQSTINRFDQSSSPYQKLGQLHALVQLIAASLSYPDSCTTPFRESDHSRDSQERLEGRRSGGPPSSRSGSSIGGNDNPLSPRTFTPGTDAIVNEIERLLRQPDGIRPRHLLRDMQLIATFIPSSILDLRADGKAFWDMTVAVSGLKNEVVQYVVRKGTQYVEVEESSRTSQEADKTGCRPILQDDEERTRMSEAVRLFTIGAKESHPVAQRELAILYMSLPMLPSSSSPSSGYLRAEGSPLLTHTSRIPSPVSIATSRFGKTSQRTNTPPPSSPKGTVSSNSFLGKTASIPIKQRTRHQHSGSSSGSSFGSGMLSGLGIITGLGSFTTSSSIGSGGSEGPNSSTASLLQQPTATEFAEGIHDVDRYYDSQPGRQSGAACMVPHQNSGSLYPHAQHRSRQLPSNSAGPDKFNPENIAAAMHWFTLAAEQGDKFSINYLKHKETAGGMLSDLG